MHLVDQTVPDGPRVGVGVVVVNHNGDVPLALRKRPPEADCWSAVGGKVEFMERLADAAKRETLETGLVVALERLLGVTDHPLPDEHDHWFAPAYLARVVGGTLYNAEPEKTAAVQFFPPGELPENLTLTARNALELLKVSE